MTITAADLDNSGRLPCTKCKEVLAALLSAQNSGALSASWGDRSMTFASGKDLQSSIDVWQNKVATACGGSRTSGMRFLKARITTTPVGRGEGREIDGDL